MGLGVKREADDARGRRRRLTIIVDVAPVLDDDAWDDVLEDVRVANEHLEPVVKFVDDTGERLVGGRLTG
eukprot:CAMPEP_0119274598 /NCGR_PEP_ID=MMETSP1329-20130426/12429_1 /TAXON_ID=114041 /ORGANISM="Genus nov. species nov., Strain RCC1024" /LENGTH=69 /DNA_ID=CAMNT_0007274935 /DNA_START=1 /DNA_END=210 /DNA_ORIENTATION=+